MASSSCPAGGRRGQDPFIDSEAPWRLWSHRGRRFCASYHTRSRRLPIRAGKYSRGRSRNSHDGHDRILCVSKLKRSFLQILDNAPSFPGLDGLNVVRGRLSSVINSAARVGDRIATASRPATAWDRRPDSRQSVLFVRNSILEWLCGVGTDGVQARCAVGRSRDHRWVTTAVVVLRAALGLCSWWLPGMCSPLADRREPIRGR